MTHCDLRLEGTLDTVQGATSGVVLVQGGRVLWCGPAAQAPAVTHAQRVVSEGRIAPAFVDLHVHGGAGGDAADGSEASLAALCGCHARGGTAALCPTVLTAPPEVMLHALECIARLTGQRPGGGAEVLGAHLEGPFLNPARAGAQPREQLRLPDPVLLAELLAAAQGTLRVVTLAPELDGALPLIEQLVQAGVVVGLGHTDATYSQVCAALEAGARLGTHCFNAMRGVHHREVGAAGALLLGQAVVEAIADGVHLSGPMLQLLWRLKGEAGQLCLSSDCTAALDAPSGQGRLGQTPVQVVQGAVRLADGTLAGSSLTLDRAVQQLVQLGRAPVSGGLAAASRVPADLLGLDDRGRLSPGARADLLLLDPALRLRGVLLDGAWHTPPPATAELAPKEKSA